MAAPVVSQQITLDGSCRENPKILSGNGGSNTKLPHHTSPGAMGWLNAVKVAKTIVKEPKESKADGYQALLDRRNTPRMATRLPPAQVLFQHTTRTTTLLPIKSYRTERLPKRNTQDSSK